MLRSLSVLLAALASLACSPAVPPDSVPPHDSAGVVSSCPPEDSGATRTAEIAIYAGEADVAVQHDMALGRWPAGTTLCLEGVDDGRFAVVEVIDQPDEAGADVVVAPAVARRLGIRDRGFIRARLSVLDAPPARDLPAGDLPAGGDS